MTVYTQGKIQVETLIIMARDSGTMNYPVIPFTIWTCVTLSGCDCKLALFQWEIFCFFFFFSQGQGISLHLLQIALYMSHVQQ